MSLLRKLNKPLYALLAVAAIAGVLRFWNLAYPHEYVFDEIYYAKDACLYDGYSWKTCDIDSDAERYWVQERDEVGSWVHPPAGKWMIAIGEKLFGHTSFGWRFSSALFGTASCVLVAGMALLLFRSTLWAFVAGLLLATENLSFVMSRVALLDVFLGFWVTLGFLFLLLDRRWIYQRGLDAGLSPPAADEPAANSEETTEEPTPPGTGGAPEPVSVAAAAQTPPAPKFPAPIWRPWRFAMGLAFGMAIATKWSGGPALAGALLLTLLWERSRRKAAGMPHPWLGVIAREGVGMVLALVLVPVCVYLVSYARFWSLNGFDFHAWWSMQAAAERFHSTLGRLTAKGDLTHPYESQPWDWFLLRRPVNFFFKGPPAVHGNAEILAIGNPAIFWGSIAALPYAGWSWWKRRDPRCGFLIVAVFAQYLPWFLYPNRVQFLFYMVPIVPFMVLACVYAVKRISDATRGKRGVSAMAVALVGLSVGLFIFFWPVLTGFPLGAPYWDWRIWFKKAWF